MVRKCAIFWNIVPSSTIIVKAVRAFVKSRRTILMQICVLMSVKVIIIFVDVSSEETIIERLDREDKI